MANLITNAIHTNFTDTDFSILNPKGFRTDWLPGVIQEKDFYNMFPFENQLLSYNISGKELLEMLEIIQSGDKGFYQFYGIQTTVSISSTGKHSYVSAKMIKGEDIVDIEPE